VSVPVGERGPFVEGNRSLFSYEDIDGDGVKEVLSAFDGPWNRITIWDAADVPKHNANFGPGQRYGSKIMRGVDVADVDGDGKKEVLAATSGQLLVALNSKLEKRWAIRLDRTPAVMKAFGKRGDRESRVVIGCEDGSVLAMDARGALLRMGCVDAQPVHMITFETPQGPVAVFATDTGQVKGFHVPK